MKMLTRTLNNGSPPLGIRKQKGRSALRVRWQGLRTLAGVCVVATLLLTRCAGTDIGNPELKSADVQVSFASYEQNTPSGLLLDSGVTLNEAWIGVAAIRLADAGDCASDATIDLPNHYVINLLTGQSYPPLPSFKRLEGAYCSFAFGFAVVPDLPAEAPALLANNSFLIKGLRSDGVPFLLTAPLEDVLSLAAESGQFELLAPRTDLIVGFELNTWFASGLLDTVLGLLDLNLDLLSNPALVTEFLDGVEGSVTLFEDLDHDGLLDPEEMTPLARP